MCSITNDRCYCFTDNDIPTSVDFVRCDPSQMVASYTSSNTYIFDIETAKQVLKLDTKQSSGEFGFIESITNSILADECCMKLSNHFVHPQ